MKRQTRALTGDAGGAGKRRSLDVRSGCSHDAELLAEGKWFSMEIPLTDDYA